MFEQTLSAIEGLGVTIPIAAWLLVFLAAVALAVALKKPLTQPDIATPALIIGGITLLAHLLDYCVTLKVSPDLAEEINPIWRIVIDNYGLGIAKVYGLTGKILLSVLSFEFFAYYLIQRRECYPAKADNFLAFWAAFGTAGKKYAGVQWNGIFSLFSFTFALIGPFYFYIAFLNSLINDPLYYRFPSALCALAAYLSITIAAYFVLTYRSWKY